MSAIDVVGEPPQPADGLLGRVTARLPQVRVRPHGDLHRRGQVVQLRLRSLLFTGHNEPRVYYTMKGIINIVVMLTLYIYFEKENKHCHDSLCL